MSDVETVEMSTQSTGEKHGLLSVSCLDGHDTISIYSEALGSLPDKIHANYRVDQKKAVFLEEWDGGDNLASFSFQPQALLDYLKGGETLKIEIFGYRSGTEFVFNIENFQQELAKLNSQCSRLNQPTRKP